MNEKIKTLFYVLLVIVKFVSQLVMVRVTNANAAKDSNESVFSVSASRGTPGLQNVSLDCLEFILVVGEGGGMRAMLIPCWPSCGQLCQHVG